MRSDDGAVPLAQTGPERTDRSNLTILEAIDQRPARYPAMRLLGHCRCGLPRMRPAYSTAFCL